MSPVLPSASSSPLMITLSFPVWRSSVLTYSLILSNIILVSSWSCAVPSPPQSRQVARSIQANTGLCAWFNIFCHFLSGPCWGVDKCGYILANMMPDRSLLFALWQVIGWQLDGVFLWVSMIQPWMNHSGWGLFISKWLICAAKPSWKSVSSSVPV